MVIFGIVNLKTFKMKKITLFASILTALAMNSQNIIYQEDFESYTVGDNVGEDTDIPNTFLSYDIDGDGFNWGLTNPINFTQTMGDIYNGNFIMSASYITLGAGGNGNQGSLDANNILVLPMVSIPAGATGVNFDFYVGSGTSVNFYSEYYEVTVTTSNASADILAATPIYSHTLLFMGGRVVTLNLDDYIGQDVYIAFRHDTADQWMLGLDEFKIEAETLGVGDNEIEGFNYFLNRGSELILKASKPLSNLEIYNMLGQKVLAQNLSNREEKINISGFNSGVYIVKVNSGGNEKTFKLVKN